MSSTLAALSDELAGAVERAAFGGDVVDGGEVAYGVEVPDYFAVFGVEGAHVAV